MTTKKGKILIVDDNDHILQSLKALLTPEFSEVTTVKNPNLIHELVESRTNDVILLDMNFKSGIQSGNEGLYWLKEIIERDPNAVVILITAYGDVELAVKAIKKGATDFILKPWDSEKLLSTINASFKLRQSRIEVNKLKSKQKHLSEDINRPYQTIVGESSAIREVFKTIEKISKTDANIFIQGENGTGKELIAREIHRQSGRSSEVFIGVDMAALSETLFESELFGHIKGSFTDAREDRIGRFETASGGTLFLDEIGNVPLSLQTKLLAVLENRELFKLGSNIPVGIDIRLICATNMNLVEMVKNNLFREDLLYRINTIKIQIPALRNRSDDILPLTEHFLNIHSRKYKKPFLRINSKAIEKLKNYHWPGNIRELKHMMEKAVILSESDILTGSDFVFENQNNKELNFDANLSINEMEKILINSAIEKHKGNISRIAKELGVTRTTLYSKIKKYKL
ncbi:sigma-54-dependent transcriptional regulator [Bacteroidota bacterium]